MANTYTQIHIQFVFAVKFRLAMIDESWEKNLYQYITGIVKDNNHKLLQINGMEDHLHMLVGYRTHQSISDFMEIVKGKSSGFINNERFTSSHFNWQGGYGAFSYKKTDVPCLINYIREQKEHHKQIKFIDEYRGLLKEFDVEYDDRYLYHEPIDP